MDLGSEIQKANVGIRINIVKMPCVPIFRKNRQLWFFRPKFAQKWILGLEFRNGFWGWNFKNLSLDSESGSLRYYVDQFSDKTDNVEFFGLESQKSKSGFGINTSNIPCAPIFSQNGQLLILWSKLAKLPNYVQYFGSNIVEGVAESSVEAETSWVEVDGAGWRWVHGLVS